MKRLFLLCALFSMLAVGCEELLPNEQKPADKPAEHPKEIFLTDAESYIVSADGGEFMVVVTTNLEYSVVIPTEAQEWLSVADSRADVRDETLTFIVAENDTFDERSAAAELIATDGKVLQTITFVQSGQDKVFQSNGEDRYTIKAVGGEVSVAVTTNLEYNVVISEDAEEWLSLADTRAVIRKETLTFIVAENKAYDRRSTTVTLVDNEGNVLQAIEFIQRAAAMPQFACPSDEIWYTNDSTTEPTTPYETNVFGANIVSNTYSEDSERWVIKFDGDVTTIGSYAFYQCYSLTSVTIPDSVTTIGERAFYDCRNLTSVTIPDSVTTIGDYAFWKCIDLTSVTIPDNVTSIGEWAFGHCSSLTSVTIPDSVTEIGISTFAGCDSLTSVTIPDSVTSIGDHAFDSCSSLTNITIPDSVTTIGGSAFFDCSSLTSVTIPNGITTIGDYAFTYCSSLTSVTIPDNVTTIGYMAFGDCSSLTSVTIPDSVTSIGVYAFSGCSSLTSVYCKATTPPAGGYEMFDNNASGRKIYVPTESVEAYKSANYWRYYADAIVGYDFQLG